jgi:hypothetical protein
MACPVCFGGEDTAMRESLNAGIGVLMGVTAIVLAGFARLIVVLARRSREGAHLIDVGAGLHIDVGAGLQTRPSEKVTQ